MRGFSNHHLMQTCTYIGKVSTLEKYGLFVADFPFVTEKVKASTIHGELYEIPDEDTLAKLDELEVHPDWYRRKPIPAVMNENGNERTLVAELYFNELYSIEGDVEAVPSGRFQDSTRSQNL